MFRVRFGIYFDYYLDFAKLKLRVLEAEALGYHSVWIMDHLIWKGNQLPFNEKGSVLESWTTLSALVSLTRKIRLGPLVLCNSYRNPTLLAKMASTLDNISNGRLELGMGAGWHKEEYVAYGFPFPEVKHRIMQLREAVIIIKKMWTEKKPSFQGRYYNIKGAILMDDQLLIYYGGADTVVCVATYDLSELILSSSGLPKIGARGFGSLAR